MGDGELSNETKSPRTHIYVRNRSVFLMPKEEHYSLNFARMGVMMLIDWFRILHARVNCHLGIRPGA